MDNLYFTAVDLFCQEKWRLNEPFVDLHRIVLEEPTRYTAKESKAKWNYSRFWGRKKSLLYLFLP